MTIKPPLGKGLNSTKNKFNWLHIFFILFPFVLLLLWKYLVVNDDYFKYSALACAILTFAYFIIVDYSGKKNEEKSNSNLTEKSRNRTFLTIWIVTAGLIIIVIFGLLIVTNKCTINDCARAEDTFNIIVPIIASWIGTVLAFYFGRENFESATDRILQLSKDSLDDIPVEQMMISRRTMIYLKWDGKNHSSPGGKVRETIKEIIEFYEEISKDRIPILDKSLNPISMLHLSTLKDVSENEKEDSLQSFLEKSEDLYRYNTTKGYITVKPKLSLEEATRRRLDIKDCRDIFITTDGSNKGEVLGWITDSLATRFLSLKK